MGAFLLTKTMEQRPEIGLDSYDRFFPSQDTLPKGGFGNLIALPKPMAVPDIRLKCAMSMVMVSKKSLMEQHV